MKFLLIAVALSFSAQSFALNCNMVQKETNRAVAEKIECDSSTNKVVITGIKDKTFGKKQNFLIQHTSSETDLDIQKPLDLVCRMFGLKKSIGYEVQNDYSHSEEGVFVDFDRVLFIVSAQAFSVKQSSELAPVEEVTCI